MHNSKCKISAGFTLIETLVTIMVVTIMMTLVGAIFVRALELERRTVWSQRVQENATLVLESMAREIRVSTIANQDSANCAAMTLSMVHPIYGNITYSFQTGGVQKQVTLPSAATAIINSSDVQITGLHFCITGSGTRDGQSPKITILISIKSVLGSPSANVNLETTVTSRDITSEL